MTKKQEAKLKKLKKALKVLNGYERYITMIDRILKNPDDISGIYNADLKWFTEQGINIQSEGHLEDCTHSYNSYYIVDRYYL